MAIRNSKLLSRLQKCLVCMAWVSSLQQGKTKLGEDEYVFCLWKVQVPPPAFCFERAWHCKPSLSCLFCRSCADLGLLSLLLKLGGKVWLAAYANYSPRRRTWLLPFPLWSLSWVGIAWLHTCSLCWEIPVSPFLWLQKNSFWLLLWALGFPTGGLWGSFPPALPTAPCCLSAPKGRRVWDWGGGDEDAMWEDSDCPHAAG